ncbi:hypothetical protein PISL3812_03678 [Talaromyces islandicus]|uniref:Uncharacterized protein n=1 Tax=Talaromyces islandicus TaxID=28573 RepID=A0A0U1LTE7_TALIS|nr:hypothetical protein PISL3812_03678 [Talaromyces islandicus]
MNSTAHEGWQVNDNSRSSWDIVWASLTTIFACTWTIIHLPVYPRRTSERWITARKLVVWFTTFLAPEMIAFVAGTEFIRARVLVNRCNKAQTNSDRVTHEPDSWLYNRTKPLVSATLVDGEEINLPHHKWTLPQCFVILMSGLTLETQDEWIYYIAPRLAHRFIEAGVLRCSDFTHRDIQDRAKSDGFAKAFTVGQSIWVMINIIARAGYDLPITPLELSTLAYIACAVVIYAVWWHKPQGMAVPITVHLSYTRETLPEEVKRITSLSPKSWVHRRVIPSEKGLGSGLWNIGRTMQTAAVDEALEGPRNRAQMGLSTVEAMLLNNIGGVGGLVFCGLHVIA